VTPRTIQIAIPALLSAFAAALVFMTWRDVPPARPLIEPSIPMSEIVRRLEPITPLPLHIDGLQAGRVALGERLFHDPVLSRDRSISCASCHPLERGGADGLPRSPGVGGIPGHVNTPTVFNAAFNFVQFWDGRAATLEEQVAGPLHNPVEMDSNWTEVIARLSADEAYRNDFAREYPEQGITAETIAHAISAFERSLITPDSRFDRYLRGEPGTLSPDELEGYARFKLLGCSSCHQGVNVGGNLFQRFGVLGDYFADRGQATAADLGRFNVTGDEADRYVFKVPGLRNVALTAPYFHDGSAQTLEEAVNVMARYQLGRTLSAEDTRLLVAFLHTLTGDFRGKVRQ
jgi:cytochrome c peroxidase